MWQFIGTSDPTVEDGRLSHLHHVVELDATLIEALNLELGEHATDSSAFTFPADSHP